VIGRYALVFAAGIFAGILLTVGRRALRSWKIGRNRRSKSFDFERINVFGELVLPVPEDPRWKGDVRRRTFDIIEVQDGNRLYIDGHQLPHGEKADRYCRAVADAYRRQKLDTLVKKIDAVVQDGGEPGGAK